MENAICKNQLYLTNDHIESDIRSILDAKAECQRLGSVCGGFFDAQGYGNSFVICGVPVLVITGNAAKGSILYRVEGKKWLFVFVSSI